jgi:glycine/D-amino acid oxidase-like deaminating enzyme
VLGGGVSGLTTALTLLRKEICSVEVWFDARGMAPPNWVWEYPPYNVEPKESALRWARESLPEFIGLAQQTNNSSGVHLIRVVDVAKETCRTHEGSDVLSEHFPYNTGKAALDEAYELLWAQDMHRDDVKYDDAVVYTAPVCDSAKYLVWLQSQITALGGVLKQIETIANVAQTVHAADESVVAFVNCLGFGAKDALPDSMMYANQGQLLHIDAPWVKAAFFAEASDVYMIPCPGCPLELGGSATDNRLDRRPDSQELARILRENVEAVPSLSKAVVGDPWVGVRPKRKGGVRLELEYIMPPTETNSPQSGGGGGGRAGGSGDDVTAERAVGRPVVHNYGHGGSGMCCSYGCANDVAVLIRGVLGPPPSRAGRSSL